jgi:hypothetical protein
MSNYKKSIEGIKQHYIDNYLEDPLDGSLFDCDVFDFLDYLKHKYTDEKIINKDKMLRMELAKAIMHTYDSKRLMYIVDYLLNNWKGSVESAMPLYRLYQEMKSG